jgi:hypothetical protein
MNFFSIGGVGLLQLMSGTVAEASYDRLEPSWAFSMVFLTFAIPLAIALLVYLASTDRPPREQPGKSAVSRKYRPSS